MKLEPELIKKILIAYEDLPYPYEYDSIIEIDGYSDNQVEYHSVLLEEAGYIIVSFQWADGRVVDYMPERLTYLGHEFLNISRNDTNWNKTKQVFEKLGGFTLDLAKAYLIALLKENLFTN